MNFKITYTDPKTEEEVVEFIEFEDTPNVQIGGINGSPISYVNIPARGWAEDYAYGVSNKGSYEVEEIK